MGTSERDAAKIRLQFMQGLGVAAAVQKVPG